MITNLYDFYRKTPAEIYIEHCNEHFNRKNDDEHIAEIARAEIAAAKAAEAAKLPDIEPKEEKEKVKVEYVIDEQQLAKELDKALKRIFR